MAFGPFQHKILSFPHSQQTLCRLANTSSHSCSSARPSNHPSAGSCRLLTHSRLCAVLPRPAVIHAPLPDLQTIPVQDLVACYFKDTFISLDKIEIQPSMRLRRIFTLPEKPTAASFDESVLESAGLCLVRVCLHQKWRSVAS